MWRDKDIKNVDFRSMKGKTAKIRANTALFGALLVFIGAICFSAKAVMVKMAYRYDIDGVSLLTLRMMFSLPLFVGVMAWSKYREGPMRARLSRRDWTAVALLGLSGYYFASLFDFLGLQYISAGMERLILFVYPTLVVLISALVYRQPITKVQLMALSLTYAGITLAFIGNIKLTGGSTFWLGAGLIFVSALAYAIYLVGSGRLIPKLGTLRYTSLAMTIAALMIVAHHGVVYQWRLFHYPAEVYYLALLMAAVATVLPSLMVSEGIRLVGSSHAAIIGSVGPIATIALAYIFLDEKMGWLQWLGTIVVIGGVLLISLRKNEE